MNINTEQIIKEVLKLPLVERANLADKLLASLEQPDRNTDEIWCREIEERIAAYETGKMETVSVEEVLAKYRK